MIIIYRIFIFQVNLCVLCMICFIKIRYKFMYLLHWSGFLCVLLCYIIHIFNAVSLNSMIISRQFKNRVKSKILCIMHIYLCESNHFLPVKHFKITNHLLLCLQFIIILCKRSTFSEYNE